MVNRWETPRNVRSRVPAWLRLSTLAVVVVTGVTTAPLHAQPGACERPAITVTTSPTPVDDDGGPTSVAFGIEVDVGGSDYCFWEVTYQTGGGDATPGEDYRPINPRTECRSGNDTIEGSVDILSNTEAASDKTFEVQVPSIMVGGCADGDLFDVDESATVIIGNYRSPSVSIDDVEIEEGDEGLTNAVFTVRVEPAASGPIAVSFQTENSEALVSDGDYKAQFGSLTIAPVEPYQATISVPVVGDTRAEEDETFTVLLTSADGAEIVDGEGVGSILNDDAADTVRIAAAPEVPEGAESADVEVERLDPSADPAQVTVTAGDGTATEGEGLATAEEDYTPVSTVVSWPAGEGGTRTVQIPLLDDELAEGDETIRVTLTDPEQATLGEPSAVDLVILDDEQEGEAEEEATPPESSDATSATSPTGIAGGTGT